MLLTIEKWNAIRLNFSEEEKCEVNAAIIGTSICPRAAVLDEEIMGPKLTKKIKELTK